MRHILAVILGFILGLTVATLVFLLMNTPLFGQETDYSDLSIGTIQPTTSFVFFVDSSIEVTVTDSMFARMTEEEVMNFAVLYLTFQHSWDMGGDITFAFFERKTTVSYAKFSSTLVKKLLPEWVFNEKENKR